MSLSNDEKMFLTTHRASIKSKFDLYGYIKSHMGVYFLPVSGRPFITFNTADNFENLFILGTHPYNYVCTFVTAGDFDTQCDAFLA